MENGLWVFRLSIEDSGNPVGKVCPRVNVQNIDKYVKTVHPLKAKDREEIEDDDDSSVSILKKELVAGRLRQGWGYEFENMNLNLNQNNWIENYICLNWRLWGEKIPYKNACGRYNILKLMKDMRTGDIIFVPRISDESKFTVATVDKRKYFFQPMNGHFGHAHVVGVEKIKEYSYDNHFPAIIFNPYRKAVCEVKEDHLNFKTLINFINKYYI